MPIQDRTAAQRYIRRLMALGSVEIEVPRHARIRMGQREISDGEILEVMKHGLVENAQYVNGSWRYQIRRAQLLVPTVIDPDADVEPPPSTDLSGVTLIAVTVIKLDPTTGRRGR